MWPFNTKPEITFEEYVSSLPMPICGDKVEHYEWRLKLRMPCPMCVAKKQNEQKEIDENRLAEKIAMEVVRLLDMSNKEAGDW